MNRINLKKVYKIGDPLKDFTDSMDWYTKVKTQVKNTVVDHITIKDVFRDLTTGSRFSVQNARFVRMGRLGMCIIKNRKGDSAMVTLSCLNRRDLRRGTEELNLTDKEMDWLMKLQLFMNWKNKKFTYCTKFNTNSYVTAYNAVRDNLPNVPYAFQSFRLFPFVEDEGAVGCYF